MEDINNEFLNFLLTAKKNTYAAEHDCDRALTKILLTDTKQFEYCQGEYSYRDIYAGTSFFVGQEIVYHKDRAFWSMVYSGGVTKQVEKNEEISDIYVFLKKVLRLVSKNNIYRGPSYFSDSDYIYENKFNGNPENFIGTETISIGKQIVYRLNYSGGYIK